MPKLKIKGASLRKKREARGFTQQKVADKAKLSIYTYQRLEKPGEGSDKSLNSVAKVLDLDPRELIDNQDKIKKSNSGDYVSYDKYNGYYSVDGISWLMINLFLNCGGDSRYDFSEFEKFKGNIYKTEKEIVEALSDCNFTWEQFRYHSGTDRLDDPKNGFLNDVLKYTKLPRTTEEDDGHNYFGPFGENYESNIMRSVFPKEHCFYPYILSDIDLVSQINDAEAVNIGYELKKELDENSLEKHCGLIGNLLDSIDFFLSKFSKKPSDVLRNHQLLMECAIGLENEGFRLFFAEPWNGENPILYILPMESSYVIDPNHCFCKDRLISRIPDLDYSNYKGLHQTFDRTINHVHWGLSPYDWYAQCFQKSVLHEMKLPSQKDQMLLENVENNAVCQQILPEAEAENEDPNHETQSTKEEQ